NIPMPCDIKKRVPKIGSKGIHPDVSKTGKACSTNYSGLSATRPGKFVIPVTLLLLMKMPQTHIHRKNTGNKKRRPLFRERRSKS
ncbi:hypothetical protein, partial [Akkermansia sp.]|uniref:hypothetical protein n=1 Tax=Akkermansia sp. TaxID=1872421 RepID=UPI0025B85816